MRGPPPRAPEDFFREVNDRIVELGQRFGLREERLELVCECDDTACTEHLTVPSTLYEQVRSAEGQRVVAAAHAPTARVAAWGDGYVVVED